MSNNTVKMVLGVIVLVLLFGVLMTLLKFLIKTLLPIALIVIAGYIVYRLVTKKR